MCLIMCAGLTRGVLLWFGCIFELGAPLWRAYAQRVLAGAIHDTEEKRSDKAGETGN